MGIPLIDKSNYLKGLLILARKDNNVSDIQRSLILKAGKQLGFSSSFCEEIVNTLLHNDCLNDDPIRFENYAVAQSFISDGIKLTCTGKEIIEAELNWLRKLAEINSINIQWVEEQLANNEYMIKNPFSVQLSLYSII